MTDATHTPSTAPLQAESAASSELSGLNARTARRQKLLLGSLGAIALLGGSWFILGGDDKAKTGDPNAAQTIDRIIDMFPPNQQDQVRVQLAGIVDARRIRQGTIE